MRDPYRYDLVESGLRIKMLRNLKNVSQSEMAETLGFSKVHLSKAENGIQGFSPEYMMRIAIYFNVPLEYLYFGQHRDASFKSQLRSVIAILTRICGDDLDRT